MGFYDGFRKGNVTRRNGEGGNTIGSGDYPAVMIARCKHLVEGFNGERFIVEMVVLEAAADAESAEGAIVSKSYRLDGQWGHLGYGDVMGFLGLAHGIPASEDKITDWGKLAEQACESGALDGKIMGCSVRKKGTRSGQEVTAVSWCEVDPNIERRVADKRGEAQKAYADAGATDEPEAPSLPSKGDDAPPSLPAAFPPPGWKAHPNDGTYYFKGKLLKKEHELRAMVAAGTA